MVTGMFLQWCRENGGPWDSSTCEAAAQHGHLHVFAMVSRTWLQMECRLLYCNGRQSSPRRAVVSRQIVVVCLLTDPCLVVGRKIDAPGIQVDFDIFVH